MSECFFSPTQKVRQFCLIHLVMAFIFLRLTSCLIFFFRSCYNISGVVVVVVVVDAFTFFFQMCCLYHILAVSTCKQYDVSNLSVVTREMGCHGLSLVTTVTMMLMMMPMCRERNKSQSVSLSPFLWLHCLPSLALSDRDTYSARKIDDVYARERSHCTVGK